MRPLMILPVILLAGCGGGGGGDVAEADLTKVDGRVVSVKSTCEIVPPPSEAAPEPVPVKAGDCNTIIPESRKLENRENVPHRKLEVTFVFTSPADRQLHQVTSIIHRPISARVPRPGERIEVMAHPQDAAIATLPGAIANAPAAKS